MGVITHMCFNLIRFPRMQGTMTPVSNIFQKRGNDSDFGEMVSRRGETAPVEVFDANRHAQTIARKAYPLIVRTKPSDMH